MKKNIFMLLLFSSCIFAQELREDIYVSGRSEDNGFIEYYSNGLIKRLSLYDRKLEFDIKKVSNSNIDGKITWIEYDDVNETIFNIKIDADKIIINEDFIKPGNAHRSDKIITIRDEAFFTDNFYYAYREDKFKYKDAYSDFVMINNRIYDIASINFEKEKPYSSQSVKVLEANKKQLALGFYNLYSYESSGEGVFIKDENIIVSPYVNKDKFSPLYKFINFYLVSSLFIKNEFLPYILVINQKYSDFSKQNQIIYYNSSSFLREGNINYSADNLSSHHNNIPYASANGYGIGDKIYLYVDVEKEYLTLNLYNGFQSVLKPYLYEQNSRAKKIQIKNIDNGNIIVFEVSDIPEVQKISLAPITVNAESVARLELTILEVYPGTKYKDLCIHAILAE